MWKVRLLWVLLAILAITSGSRERRRSSEGGGGGGGGGAEAGTGGGAPTVGVAGSGGGAGGSGAGGGMGGEGLDEMLEERAKVMPVFVMFYAPVRGSEDQHAEGFPLTLRQWCNHCKRMAQAWSELGDRVRKSREMIHVSFLPPCPAPSPFILFVPILLLLLHFCFLHFSMLHHLHHLLVPCCPFLLHRFSRPSHSFLSLSPPSLPLSSLPPPPSPLPLLPHAACTSMQITKVDCTSAQGSLVCSRHGIKAYPTLKLFFNAPEASHVCLRSRADGAAGSGSKGDQLQASEDE
eukprot:527450-Hanusia_phi.AAC.1